MSRRGRAVLTGLAVAILFALPLLPEIAGTRRLVFRDAHMTHWPWRRLAMETLSSGRAPFVNASASGGQPFLANPNAGLLYPTILLEKVVSPASAFNLHYLLHVLWAYFGARALASRLGLSPGAAFVSGVAFAFSGTMLSYGAAFANAGPAASWLPWCAAAALEVARARSLRRLLSASAAAGLAFGLQLLAGEPALSLLTVVFAGFLVLAEWVSSRDRRLARAGWVTGGGALAGVVAAGIAAPLLLPLRQVLPLTYRGQHLYSARAFGASPFTPSRIVEWLFPRFGGDPGSLGEGAHWQYRLHEGDLVYLWAVTFGVLPFLALALAALRRSFWSRSTVFLSAGAVLSLLFAFGLSLPFYRILFSAGFLRRLRYPIKFYLLTTLCVALLAGFAAEALRQRRGGRREAFVLAGALAIFAVGFLAATDGGLIDRLVRPHLAGLAAPAERILPAIRRVFRADALLGMAAAGVLGLVVSSRRGVGGSAHALGFATLLLAFPFGLPLFVSAVEKDLSRPPAVLRELDGPGRLYVSPGLPELAVLETGTAHPELPPTVAKLARVQVEEMIPATGTPFGARYLFDEDPDGSYGWVNRIAGEVFTSSTPEERARLLRLFGARWTLGEARQYFSGFSPVTEFSVAGRRILLSESAAAAPEIRWASRAHRRASLSGALELARSDLFRAQTDVVLPADEDRGPGPAGPPAALRVKKVEAGRALAEVDAAAPGHLLFSRTFFSAWKATVDGASARVLLANGRDLAVAVPAGRHRVEFFYDVSPFRLGVLLQVLAFLLALAAAARELPRRPRPALRQSTEIVAPTPDQG